VNNFAFIFNWLAYASAKAIDDVLAKRYTEHC